MAEESILEKEVVSPIVEPQSDEVEVQNKPAVDVVLTEAETEQLMDAIRRQVEYYFSKENLQTDPYLTSHMDANMTVSIAIVMKFAKMKALTQDESLLRRALETSTITIVDDRIKANIKAAGRFTIILREIPSDTTEVEVREIFAFEGCKQITSMRSDIGDTWFVMMDSEDDAKDTLLDLRLKKRMFRGQSVKGRLKSETVVRSFYPVQAAPSMSPAIYPGMNMQYGGGGFIPGPMDNMQMYGYNMNMNNMMGGMNMGPGMMPPPPMGDMPVPGLNGAPSPPSSSNEEVDKMNKGRFQGSSGTIQGSPAQQSSSAIVFKNGPQGPSGGNGSVTSKDSGNRDRNSKNGLAISQPARQNSNGNKDSSRPGPVKVKTAASATGPVPRATIEINTANFPPLSTSKDDEGSAIPVPGYTTPFIKYTFDDIISIVKDIKVASLPASIKPSDHPYAMSKEANNDLLKRQRTFSIDETREQLKQGKPVTREAVLACSPADYNSMIFGDKETPLPSGAVSAPPKAVDTTVVAIKSELVKEKVEGASISVIVPESLVDARSSPLGDSKKVPTSHSWAAMVASQIPSTETPIVVPAAGAPRAPRTGSKDSTPASPDRKSIPRPAAPTPSSASSGKKASGTTSGSVAGEKGAPGDKSRDRRRDGGRKEGDRKEGERGGDRGGDRKEGDRPNRGPGGGDRGERRDRGGRDRENKGVKKPENGTVVHEESGSTSSHADSVGVSGAVDKKVEEKPTLGWGKNPSFSNILKQQQAAEAAASGASKRVEKGTAATPTATLVTATVGSAVADAVAAPAGDKGEKDGKGEKHSPTREKSVPQGQTAGAPNKKAAISAGVWAKETLPPRKAPAVQADV